MDRPGKFDNEIRKKMTPLEGEPSARVWANVRGEIGMENAGNSTPAIYYRIAVAATIVLLIGIGIFFNRSGNEVDASQLANRNKDTIQETPLPQQKMPQLAVNPVIKEEALPSSKSLKPFPKAEFPKKASPVVNEAPEKKPAKSAPIREMPMELEQFVEQNPKQKLEELPSPVPELAPQEETFAENNSPEIQKREIRIPRLEDLSMDNLRKKSGGILASLSDGANNYLGMETNYEEEIQKDIRRTEFSANFGLFKVKRVRKIKD